MHVGGPGAELRIGHADVQALRGPEPTTVGAAIDDEVERRLARLLRPDIAVGILCAHREAQLVYTGIAVREADFSQTGEHTIDRRDIGRFVRGHTHHAVHLSAEVVPVVDDMGLHRVAHTHQQHVGGIDASAIVDRHANTQHHIIVVVVFQRSLEGLEGIEHAIGLRHRHGGLLQIVRVKRG